MYVFNMDEMSMDEWIKLCTYNPPVGYQRLDTKKEIIIVTTDDLLEIVNYLAGNREIPALKDAEDVLGDIEEEYLHPDYEEDWDIDDEENMDINDFVDTRGCIPHFHFKYAHEVHIENNIHYHYPHKGGYPSYIE